MRLVRIGAVFCGAVALAGCMASGAAGTLVGAAGGPAGGALVDGVIGNQIGSDLDQADRQIAMQAEYRALEFGRTGAPTGWRSRSGRYGEIIPGAAYRVNDTSCRDYTHTIFAGGQPQAARGTACRQPDGTWRAVA